MHSASVHITQHIILPKMDGNEFIRKTVQKYGLRSDPIAPETICRAYINGHEFTVNFLKAFSREQTLLAVSLSKSMGIHRYVDMEPIETLDLISNGITKVFAGYDFVTTSGSVYIRCAEKPDLSGVARKLGFRELVKNVQVLDRRGLSFSFSNHIDERVIQATVESNINLDGRVGTNTLIAFGNRLISEFATLNSVAR